MARGGLVLLGLLCVLASAAAIQEVASFTARNGMAPLALKGRADARTPQPMRLRGGEGLGCVVDVLGTAVGTATTFIVSPPVFMVIAAAGVYKAWEGTLFKGKGKKSVKKAAPAKAEKPAAASSAPKKGCLGLGCFGL